MNGHKTVMKTHEKQDSCTANIGKLKAWFEDYVQGFSSDDPVVQENMDLKRDHTIRVCKAIVDIGNSLHLSKEDLCIAEISALLHDIGRFEQYKRYRTFSDFKSEDHGILGAKIIQDHGILDGLEEEKANMIVRITRYHNRASLPSHENERCIFFLKMVRDADKIDIWRVVTDYYHNKANRHNPAIELDLPNTPAVSDPVCSALMRGQLVQMTDVKTLNDFKLLQIGWIYDINFPRTFEIIREKRYLEKIWDVLPKTSDKLRKAYERAEAYLNRLTHNGTSQV